MQQSSLLGRREFDADAVCEVLRGLSFIGLIVSLDQPSASA
jgi:hypothetical protein